MNLTRFRANPEKVRVAIHRDGAEWVVTVGSRARSLTWEARNKSPIRATWLALKKAERGGLEGVDLGMGWAYPHPMRGNVVVHTVEQ